MEIFKKEIDGKLHIRIEYTEEEKAKIEAEREKRKAEMEAKKKEHSSEASADDAWEGPCDIQAEERQDCIQINEAGNCQLQLLLGSEKSTKSRVSQNASTIHMLR